MFLQHMLFGINEPKQNVTVKEVKGVRPAALEENLDLLVQNIPKKDNLDLKQFIENLKSDESICLNEITKFDLEEQWLDDGRKSHLYLLKVAMKKYKIDEETVCNYVLVSAHYDFTNHKLLEAAKQKISKEAEEIFLGRYVETFPAESLTL